MTEDEYKAGEILPFPSTKAGASCPACGRTIDASGICKCDPEWVSPAELKAELKVSERDQILIEIKEFLSAQMKQPAGVVPEKGTIFTCRGCGGRWLSNDLEQHDPRCWPRHMVGRIDAVLGGRV